MKNCIYKGPFNESPKNGRRLKQRLLRLSIYLAPILLVLLNEVNFAIFFSWKVHVFLMIGSGVFLVIIACINILTYINKKYLQAVIVSFLLALYIFGALFFPLYSDGRKAAYKKALMQSDIVFFSFAEEMVLFCRGVNGQMKFNRFLLPIKEGYIPPKSLIVDESTLPPVIRGLRPNYGNISSTGASFEMHGGFDHFGYILDINDDDSWTLYYYDEREKILLQDSREFQRTVRDVR